MFKWLTNWLEARRIRKEIRAVANIQLREGSVLVFEFPQSLSPPALQRFQESLQHRFGVNAIVISGGLKLAGVVHSMRGMVDANGRPLVGENGKLSAESVAVELDGQMTALRDEYGDLAPEVAAAKAKSSFGVPPMPRRVWPAPPARPELAKERLARGYQPESDVPIPARPRPPVGA